MAKATLTPQEFAEKRDRWFNSERAAEAELKHTLTNLYNQYLSWCALAHKKLDETVLDAYGSPHDITDDDIPERLLALNLEREGKQQGK